jgi:hypothetical protein
MIRVNIGCGQTPTIGWYNYDNSMSLKLANFSLLVIILSKLRILKTGHIEFIHFLRKNNIQWADATRHIPLPDNSVEVLYSSLMVEHLDRKR